MIDSRAAKVPLNTARLALIFQLFRWACDESHKDFVDAESVNAAIRMSDYFEKSYKRMDDLVLTEATDPVKKQVLDSLGNKFVTAEAVKAGADFGLQDVLSCICSKTSVRETLSSRQARQL